VAATVVAAALGVGHGAHAHELPAAGLRSERDLQRIEAALLGPAHAAEHAPARRAPAPPRAAPVPAGARDAEDQSPAEVGAWDPAGERRIIRGGDPALSVPAINAVMLPTGKVLWFGPRMEGGRKFNTEVWAVEWDPVTHEMTDVPPPDDPRTGRPTAIYCGGASLLADGRVLVTGGYLDDFQHPDTGLPTWRGLDQVWTYDPFSRTWERHEDLGRGRWYPTQLLMPDGRTLILQGLDETGLDFNRELEVFDPSRPPGDEISRLDRLLTDAETGEYYPHLFWMPSGRALVAGPNEANSYFLEALSGTGVTLTQAADPLRRRTWGGGVLLPLHHNSRSGAVWQLGGSGAVDPDGRQPATASTEVFDEDRPDAWTPGVSLQVPRAHHNTVLLPDGSLVAVGGGTGGAPHIYATTEAHRRVELFEPGASAWRLGPAQRGDRAYHSTAVLLPDGSVVSAGDDDLADGDIDTYEIYRPPYFFRGPRPIIASAPRAVGYGRTARVESPDTDIVRAVLVAPGSTTHAVDMSQRAVSLPVVRRADGTGYDLEAPLSADVAPPGYHMLFLVDTAGRPSVASWVRLDPGHRTRRRPRPSREDPTRRRRPPSPPASLPAKRRTPAKRRSPASRPPPRVAPLRTRGPPRLACAAAVDVALQRAPGGPPEPGAHARRAGNGRHHRLAQDPRGSPQLRAARPRRMGQEPAVPRAGHPVGAAAPRPPSAGAPAAAGALEVRAHLSARTRPERRPADRRARGPGRGDALSASG
jgi:hypothetical protein